MCGLTRGSWGGLGGAVRRRWWKSLFLIKTKLYFNGLRILWFCWVFVWKVEMRVPISNVCLKLLSSTDELWHSHPFELVNQQQQQSRAANMIIIYYELKWIWDSVFGMNIYFLWLLNVIKQKKIKFEYIKYSICMLIYSKLVVSQIIYCFM